jgi:hypothetical protein
VLRWLLHRILPFPCFLWSIEYLAARLRVDLAALETALHEGKPLCKDLEETEYAGILRNFCGPRWWRTKVELWLWKHLGVKAGDDDAVYEFVCTLAGEQLERSSPPRRPLVCLNTNHEPISKFTDIENAVRIRPDGWPAYAEEAWTTIDAAIAEPVLGAIVLQEERERLKK